MRPAIMLLSLGFVLSAVPVGVAAPQVPDVPEVPTLPKDPEIRNYRLSMQKVRQVIEVMRDLNGGESQSCSSGEQSSGVDQAQR